MAKYQVQTDGGTYIVETEDTSSEQQLMDTTGKNSQGQITSKNPKLRAIANQMSPQQYQDIVNAQSGGAPDIAKVRPFDIPASLAVGSKTAEMAPGGLVPKAVAGVGIGVGTYLGLDQLLQRLSGEDPSLSSSAINLGINELGSRVVGAIKKGLTPGNLSPSQEELMKLQPTYGQATQGRLSQFIEDVFDPVNKANSIKTSGKLAEEQVNNKAQKMSGKSVATLDNPNYHAQTIQIDKLDNSLKSTYNEADKQSGLAKIVAASNPETYTITPAQTLQVPTPELQAIAQNYGGSTFEKLDPQRQQQSIAFTQKLGKQPFNQVTTPAVMGSVNGPVRFTSTLEKANEIVQDAKNLQLGPTEEQKPLVNQAYNLIQKSNAQFDPTGKLVSANPVGFEEAWNQKQQFDTFGGWNKSKNDVTHTDTQFRGLTKLMNQDIDDSLSSWTNDPNKVATKAWKNAKATVEQRNLLFFPEGSNTKLGDIVQEADSPLPAIKAIVQDPVKLQRAINSGNIKFPSGNVESNNIRGDLGAFALKDIFDNSQTNDPKNPKGGATINPQTLQDKWSDPSFAESKKLLFNAPQRADLDQFFKNIAFTQQKQSVVGSYLSKVFAVRAGFALAPSLLTGYLSGSAEHAAGVAGVELGAMGFAKLMTNPKTARFLVAAAGGQPLSASDQTVARSIVSALQGVTVSLRGNDGTEQKGSFDKDGKWVPGDN